MSVKKVLVVDDSPTERHAISEILRRAGFEVSTCDSGEEAVSQAKILRPDLVLMDVVMPGLNGFQATRQLSRDDATKHIPVIICTTKSQETDKIWGLRQGARDYVVKPVVAADLLDKISRLDA
ncbi:MAG: response regulator [Burkholderiales bacterium]|nr:response regulator [Burkholderiales bacterium]